MITFSSLFYWVVAFRLAALSGVAVTLAIDLFPSHFCRSGTTLVIAGSILKTNARQVRLQLTALFSVRRAAVSDPIRLCLWWADYLVTKTSALGFISLRRARWSDKTERHGSIIS
jgi:hypothetical protein